MSHLSRQPTSLGQTRNTIVSQDGAGPNARHVGDGQFFAVRFERNSKGVVELVEQTARTRVVNGKSTTVFTNGKRFGRGDLICKSKQSWKTVVLMYPEFADIEEPISEDETLKVYGMLLDELPTYEVGFKIQSIVANGSNPFSGTVTVNPYVLLTPEQSGEKHRKYYLSAKSVQLSLNSHGGSLNQLFINQRLVESLEDIGGGIWFAKKAVAITKEVISSYGSVFTGAAKEALKHALGVGAKKLAQRYAKRYIAKKGREAAVKRMVQRVFAKLAKLAAFFSHAATVAAIAFIHAFAADLLYQTKKNVRLLNEKTQKGITLTDTATTAFKEGKGYQVDFQEMQTAVDWKQAFWKGLVAGSAKGASAVVSKAIKEKFKFDLEIDKEITAELGEKAVYDAVERELSDRFLTKMREVVWEKLSTYIIDSVKDIAIKPDTNAENFTTRVTDSLQEKLISTVTSGFVDVGKGLVESAD